MNKIEFKNLPDMTTPLSAENINQLQDNMEDAIVPIKLVSVGATAPATATIGDMYYNTTDNKIYTANAENTWDSGSEPRYDGFYIDINNHNTYYYNGTSLVISSNEILTSLSDIGITITDDTTLDAIVTAVPNGKTLQLYLSDDNASTLYGTSGGRGNLPTNIAGILTVQRNSENNWVYISYNTNLSVDENENAGLFYTTKFTGYRDWKSVLFKSEVQDGKPIPTGRKIGGKDEYFVEKQITTPAVNDNFSTVFAFTQDVVVHEMSSMVFPNGFDDDQYPNTPAFDYLFRHGTGVIARVTSENSWWASRTGIIRMYFIYND